MGAILCPAHGECGISFVSPLVAEWVLRDQRPDDAIEKVILEIEPDRVSTHPVNAEFARLVRGKFALSGEIVRLPPEEASMEVFDMLTAVCNECLSDWLRSKQTL
jgi:hypothetical protein